MVYVDNHTTSNTWIDFPTWVNITTCHTRTSKIIMQTRQGVVPLNLTFINKGHSRHRANRCANRRARNYA